MTEKGSAAILVLIGETGKDREPVNIIERARTFVQSLWELAGRTGWDWKRCPSCGSMVTVRWGTYKRHPWYLEGRRLVRVQRHKCYGCGRTYSERSPWLVGGSWYAREVHRCAIDHWQHGRTSLRRTAEFVRSWIGKQERYVMWCPLVALPPQEAGCHLGASTVHRWLDRAGCVAQQTVPGQLAGIASSETLGVDGLWARLKGKAQRVVLMTADSVSGLIWPPVIARGEQSEGPWSRLFARAQQAGLDLDGLRAVTSDGAQGVSAYLKRRLAWVHHQRCVWHIWRTLSSDITQAASQAAQGLEGDAATQAREQAKQDLTSHIHHVLDAKTYDQAEQALATLSTLPLADKIAQTLNLHLDRLLLHTLDYCQGLQRVSPEWYWRDFRLRLSRGRNHRSDRRLERAALVWAIYHNFTPAQYRSERKRRYRHPGLSPLEVAGSPLQNLSYLDALGV